MNGLDIFILIVLLVGLVKGWMSGLLRQIVSIVGFLAGLLVAMMLYSVFGDWLAPCIGTDVSVGRALAFVLLWIGIPIILLWIARILTRTIEAVSLGGLNRLGGACIGLLKYMMILSCVLNVAVRVHLISDGKQCESRLYSPVQSLSGVLFDYCKCHVTKAVEKAVTGYDTVEEPDSVR